VNIFQYQGQEEDHYTNILMNILALNNCQLVQPFLENLIANRMNEFLFQNVNVFVRRKNCPQKKQKHEMIIGIAPFIKAIDERNILEDNLNSIPDAWICGENFNILLEFKIRGFLDESQIAAHRRLLGDDASIIRLQWDDILDALGKCRVETSSIVSYLIEQFNEVSQNFREKRRSSGMPTQIISNVKKEMNVYFVITGNKQLGAYTVDKVENGNTDRLNNNLNGIQVARRWIANYISDNHEHLSIDYEGNETIVSDYCVVPGRPIKKNQWNQWRIGAILKE
jgi:hypothetical protein